VTPRIPCSRRVAALGEGGRLELALACAGASAGRSLRSKRGHTRHCSLGSAGSERCGERRWPARHPHRSPPEPETPAVLLCTASRSTGLAGGRRVSPKPTDPPAAAWDRKSSLTAWGPNGAIIRQRRLRPDPKRPPRRPAGVWGRARTTCCDQSRPQLARLARLCARWLHQRQACAAARRRGPGNTQDHPRPLQPRAVAVLGAPAGARSAGCWRLKSTPRSALHDGSKTWRQLSRGPASRAIAIGPAEGRLLRPNWPARAPSRAPWRGCRPCRRPSGGSPTATNRAGRRVIIAAAADGSRLPAEPRWFPALVGRAWLNAASPPCMPARPLGLRRPGERPRPCDPAPSGDSLPGKTCCARPWPEGALGARDLGAELWRPTTLQQLQAGEG